MTAPEKIFVTVEYIGKTDTVVCGAFGTYPMDESVEFTRTDLSQAAVAAALEAAVASVKAHSEKARKKMSEARDLGAERTIVERWYAVIAHLDNEEEVIRALITKPQHDALAAHVAAEVAKARAEDAELLYNAWLGLRVLENIAKVKGLSGAADVTTPLLAEIEAAHPEFAPRSALRAQIGAKP